MARTERIAGFIGTLCLGFLLGLTLAGDAYTPAALFCGAGAGLMLVVCAIAAASANKS